MTYVSPVFAHVRPDILYDLQIVQDKFCKRTADAPLYVKNSVLHRDLELPTISKYMKGTSERFFDEASSHPNPLLFSAVSYEPPPSHHFCRIPRNVLLYPPDDLNVEASQCFAYDTADPSCSGGFLVCERRAHLCAEHTCPSSSENSAGRPASCIDRPDEQ
ncbi:hypothetical protein EVAR_92905_1 [Eumeta japonica]|uniref:Uncharacterized protein n=1 Tax=Eumeta variegata TaxID=151549 RepID=A0A4C1TA64_EUMVA|nr:hypothetical protein EVAR_92905_1 [Eumeta japonica]